MQGCFHGGEFWEDVGPRFDGPDRREQVVNADVLDAWFPPSPRAVAALRELAPWSSHTSPPTRAEGLTEVVAEKRGLAPEDLLVGAGSSSLIFLALREWLTPSSRVLLVEPTYGEYAHVCQQLGCRVDRFELERHRGFVFDIESWASKLSRGRYDLAVIVNPNNPVGTVLSCRDIERALASVPASTRVLVDEAYLDYTAERSCERLAVKSENLFVVKSLSKGLALSGLRVAYLAGPRREVVNIERWSPPWAVSLPAQIAAVHALNDSAYYRDRYRETSRLRGLLAERLCGLGGEIYEGAANWVLYRLPADFPRAGEVVRQVRLRKVHVRDAGVTAPSLCGDFIRVAVKQEGDQDRILAALRHCR